MEKHKSSQQIYKENQDYSIIYLDIAFKHKVISLCIWMFIITLCGVICSL